MPGSASSEGWVAIVVISAEVEAVFSRLADAVVASDARGVIVCWNPAAERLFGFTADEAIGQTLDLITPEAYRERHWEGYRRAMEQRHSRYAQTLLQVPALHKNGQRLSIAFTVSLLVGDAGEVDMVLALVRDETERFAADKLLRQKLADLQATGQGMPDDQQ